MDHSVDSRQTGSDDLPGIDREGPSSWSIDLAIRLVLLGLLFYLTLVIVRPLSSIMIWSVVLAVAFYPMFEWLAAVLGGRRRLAAIIIAAGCVLVVLGPVTWVVLSLIESIQALVRHFESGEFPLTLPLSTINDWPLIGKPLHELVELASANFAAAFVRVSPQLKGLGNSLLSFVGTASTAILTLLVSIVIAGFLLTPGPMLVAGVKAFAKRIAMRRGVEFVELAGATTRKVVRGVIGIALLQAVLAGIGMEIIHVPAAATIAFVAFMLGIVQIGPGIVLIPVIIWSWFAREPATALLFTAYIVPVGFLDNVLRPVVMGRGLATPVPVVFSGLIGGVMAYGMIGVLIGPIVLGIAWGLLVAWVNDAKPAASNVADRDVVDPVDRGLGASWTVMHDA